MTIHSEQLTIHPSPESLNAERKQEHASLKRLFGIIALATLATLAAKWLLNRIIFAEGGLLVSLLQALPEGVREAYYFHDLVYFLFWISNDIVVYLPSLLIFGLVMRRYMGQKETGYYGADACYTFKRSWLILAFFGSYSLSRAMSYISHLIAFLLQPVFGGDGLPDIFGEVMPQSTAQVFAAIFFIGIMAGVCEELVYRHFLLRPLRRFGDMQAIIITSLLFGFFHGNFTQFLYTTAAGFIYGIVAVRANSVIPAIFLHTVNNTYIVMINYGYDLAWAMSENGDGFLMRLLDGWGWFMLSAGLLMFVFMWAKGILKAHNYNRHLTTAERVRTAAENPLMLVMWIVLIIITIRGTMR